jgi:hypothetical protein
VRVVQQIGSRRGEAIPPNPAPTQWMPQQPLDPEPEPPPPPEDPPPPREPVASSDGYIDLSVDVTPRGGGGGARPSHQTGGGWRGATATTNGGWRGSPSTHGGWRGSPSSTGSGSWHGSGSTGWHGASSSGSGGGGWHGAPSSGGGGGGFHLPSGEGGGGGKGGEMLVVIAVIAVVVVAVAAIAVVGAEGARFDGYVEMSPAQPVHLKRAGTMAIVPLGDLTAANVTGVDEALVMDDEGYGFRRLESRLDRKGFAFKLDVGTLAFTGADSSTVVGPTAHFQIGGFFTNHFGALLTGEVGGATDKFGATVSRHSVGIELQELWLNHGPLHVGNYLNVGRAFSGTTDSDVIREGMRYGGGLLAEVDLNGRVALMLRAGASVAQLDRWSGDATGTIGLAVY